MNYNRINQKPAPHKPIVEESIEVDDTQKNVQKTAKVISDVPLNIRQGPGLTNNILCLAQPGDKLILGETHDDWASVRTKDDIDGYVLTKYIKVF